jgi:SAM-dependent methyltransferase
MPLTYPFHRLQAVGHSLLARVTRKRCFGYASIKAHLQGKSGLEFGGPSSIFSANHLVPVYDIVRAIDSCNFAQQTIWSSEDGHLRFGSRLGRQFIVEAGDASGIADESYDFVAASHVLEHVANPLRALQEWKRILEPSGTILVVVPHKAGMFDHRRPFTTFDHIQRDFESNVTEGDLTHLPEILQLHDLELDPPAGSPEQFHERCLRNLSNRAIHHHVFSPELLVEMFSFLDLHILNMAVERPYHIIVHAVKRCKDCQKSAYLENAPFLNAEAEWRGHDPFRMKFKKAVN